METDNMDSLEIQVAKLREEVIFLKETMHKSDAIELIDSQSGQPSSQKDKKLWHLDISVLIALVALLFSFGTTFYSARQEERQRIRDARIELRELVQRLYELPKENIETTQVYTDAIVIGQLSGLYQQENALLARQASEIISSIPEYVSSSEYIMVANAMLNSNLMDESIWLLDKAESIVNDHNDGVAIYRFKGQLYFLAGAIEEGRASFQKALQIFDKYPAPNAQYESSTHAQTYVNWSQLEATQGFCQNAVDLLEQAKSYIAQLSIEGYPTLIEQQINQTQDFIDVCE